MAFNSSLVALYTARSGYQRVLALVVVVVVVVVAAPVVVLVLPSGAEVVAGAFADGDVVEAVVEETGWSTHVSLSKATATLCSPKPRKPPTPRTTFATLPDRSKIMSLMSPIFSFASLYTATPASLDARHSPSLCIVAVVVDSTRFVAVCADATPVIHAVARNAIARHLEIMVFLHRLEKQ